MRLQREQTGCGKKRIKRLLTHKGSPSRGPTMARKRGCWSSANRALIRDCMPVRLPNWEDGYLHGTNSMSQTLTTHLNLHLRVNKISVCQSI